MASARQIMNAAVLRSRGNVLELLSIVVRLLLSDATSSRLKIQAVSSDHILASWCLPLSALQWIDMKNIHAVDLFQSSALAFTQKEVYDDRASEIACSKDVAVLVADCRGDEWREE